MKRWGKRGGGGLGTGACANRATKPGTLRRAYAVLAAASTPTAPKKHASNKEIDWHVKELRQPLRLCLADRPPATQYFRGSSLVAQDWPDVLVLQPAFFHQRVQRFAGRDAG